MKNKEDCANCFSFSYFFQGQKPGVGLWHLGPLCSFHGRFCQNLLWTENSFARIIQKFLARTVLPCTPSTNSRSDGDGHLTSKLTYQAYSKPSTWNGTHLWYFPRLHHILRVSMWFVDDMVAIISTMRFIRDRYLFQRFKTPASCRSRRPNPMGIKWFRCWCQKYDVMDNFKLLEVLQISLHVVFL